MRIHRHRQRKPKYQIPRFNINEKIPADEVRLIHEGFNDILPLAKAIEKARELGMDLIEVSPKANPPVCKIMDFGTFKYQKVKEAKKQRAQSKEVEVKGIRLKYRISVGDLDVRRKQAAKFLEKGHKVKIEMPLRGREREHKDRAKEIINTFIDTLRSDFEIRVDTEPTYQGDRFNAIIGKIS